MTIDGGGSASWINDLSPHQYPALLLAAAAACNELRHHKTAVTILELCATLEPDNSAALILLGRSYIASGESEKAIQVLERVPLSSHGRGEARSLLLWCYSSLSDRQCEPLAGDGHVG